jgi:putative ABC transport system permease protein
MLDLVLSTVSQGLLWAIMALGVFLTFRVLDIADLSVEGTFPLGAAVAATLIDAGHSVWFAMLIALIAGCIGGTVTALLTTKLKIPAF